MKSTEIPVTLDGKTIVYKQVRSGTCFRKETPEKLMRLLEKLRHDQTEVRIYNGNTETGQSYLDEVDVTGTIGRSTGQIKVPLLVPLGDCSGGTLMEHAIVRIDSREKTLYRHPKFFVGDITVKLGLHKDKPWEVYVGEKFHALFKTNAEATHFSDFLHGKVFDPPNESDETYFNIGEKVKITSHHSEPGEGLSYPDFEGTTLEEFAAGGWDVVEVKSDAGEEISVYAFSVEPA